MFNEGYRLSLMESQDNTFPKSFDVVCYRR